MNITIKINSSIRGDIYEYIDNRFNRSVRYIFDK